MGESLGKIKNPSYINSYLLADSSNLFQNAQPFGVAPGDESHHEEEGDGLGDLHHLQAAVNINRRTSVSAESIKPNKVTTKTIIPKSDQQKAFLQESLKKNFLFKNLQTEQYDDVLNAMNKIKVTKGKWVIEEGDDGDYFYVVDSGEFSAYIRVPATSNDFDNDVTPPASCPKEFKLKNVLDYTKGGSFGELALMYNAPRAASILAKSDSELWSVDRLTFRSILLNHTYNKRNLYDNFLSEVDLLKSLHPSERSKIADALESRSYSPNEVVISQGDTGDAFYFVEQGEADIIKNGEKVGSYKKGDYFGELALLNSAPRAATVKASENQSTAENQLKVVALDAPAFTRLLGPVRDIMARHAETY